MFELIVIAVSGVSLTGLFTDCLEKGMIFEFWGKIINGKWWGKPLGGCFICTNIWATAFMLFIFYFASPLWIILAVISISNLISKNINN